ncbi:MAG: thiamine biosynthesis protein ThiS [Candidatus Binatia bacterium]|nr:thiamine biosynthesis protein ThiS [Candidatus Binatia bacterium]MDG2008980.1 thiamine biosynthesis protein ThiS [Candidatus Binatia bacterium]
MSGVRRVHALLHRLQLLPSTVLVIRGDALLTEDAVLEPDDEIEIRSVISGG